MIRYLSYTTPENRDLVLECQYTFEQPPRFEIIRAYHALDQAPYEGSLDTNIVSRLFEIEYESEIAWDNLTVKEES